MFVGKQLAVNSVGPMEALTVRCPPGRAGLGEGLQRLRRVRRMVCGLAGGAEGEVGGHGAGRVGGLGAGLGVMGTLGCDLAHPSGLRGDSIAFFANATKLKEQKPWVGTVGRLKPSIIWKNIILKSCNNTSCNNRIHHDILDGNIM